MHQLNNPEFSIRYLDGGVRILAFRSAAGERIGVECNQETAEKWAALIVAPELPVGHGRFDVI
jgi:hypothetical protein